MCDECFCTPCAELCPNNNTEYILYCPVCKSVLGDTVYKNKDGETVGCSQCIRIENPYR